MEEDCSFLDVSEFRSIAIPDFERVSPTPIAHKKRNSQSLATARLPNYILDRRGLPYKERGRLVFRMDTPYSDL
jgi:hypothetical protein